MTQTFDHGYALLVGVGDIANYPKWSLPVTVKDMAALSNLLVDPALRAYPESEDHVPARRMTKKANSPEILNALAWLGTCARHDPGEATIVVFYSGHGWLDENSGLLLPDSS